MFTAVAAVTRATVASARFSRGVAFAVLGAAFTLRAVGDAGARAQALTWVSPLGWSLQVRPYAGDRFWVLGLHAALTVVLLAACLRCCCPAATSAPGCSPSAWARPAVGPACAGCWRWRGGWTAAH